MNNMSTLTCPQIKEMYETLYQLIAENHRALTATDTQENIDNLKDKIVATKKAFFELLYKSNVSDDHATKYIETFNHDILHVGEKDINGYWYVITKDCTTADYSLDNPACLYNPVTEYMSEVFTNMSLVTDINGYRSVEKDDEAKIFNPETRYLSDGFYTRGKFDANGYWPITTIDDNLNALFNPHTKRSSEKFKDIYADDNNGYWLIITQSGDRRFYYPLTDWKSRSFVTIQNYGLPDQDGNWQVEDTDGAIKTYNPSKDTFIY